MIVSNILYVCGLSFVAYYKQTKKERLSFLCKIIDAFYSVKNYFLFSEIDTSL